MNVYSDVVDVVVNRSIEDVFAWLTQPEHIVQFITFDPVAHKEDLESTFPPSHSSHSLFGKLFLKLSLAMVRRIDTSEIEIQLLSALPLHVGTTFHYIFRARYPLKRTVKWQTLQRGDIEIVEYDPPYQFAFTHPGRILTLVSGFNTFHRLTLAPQQGGTVIRYTQSAEDAYAPDLESQHKAELVVQLRTIKELLEHDVSS
jgi:hypothetical protein